MNLAEILARLAQRKTELKTLSDKPLDSWTEEEHKRVNDLLDEIAKLQESEKTARKLQDALAGHEGATPASAVGAPAAQPAAGQQPATPVVDVIDRSVKGEPYKNIREQLLDVRTMGTPNAPFEAREKAHNRLKEVQEARTATTKVDSEGGYFVQTSISREIIKLEEPLAHFTSDSRPLPISEPFDSLSIPYLVDKNRTDGSRHASVRAYWSGEGKTVTASPTAQTDLLTLKLKKLMAFWDATEEVLRHAGVVKELTTAEIAKELAFLKEKSTFEGAGTFDGLGIKGHAATVTVAKETGQAAGSFTYKNAVDMRGQMFPSLLMGACWYMNQEVWSQLPLMTLPVGLGGTAVFIPPNGAADAPFGRLLGLPIKVSEHCEAPGTKGDVVLANMSQYGRLQQGEMREDSSIHVNFLYDKTMFRFIEQIDGAPLWNTSLTPYKGSKKLSPFVDLADRS